MKKIIAFLLVAVMAISLAACGENNKTDKTGNSDNSSKQSEQQSGDTKNSNSKPESFDMSTVKGYLASFGYTVDDFKFTKDYSKMDAVGFRSDGSEHPPIGAVAVYQTAKKSDEEIQTWLEGFVKLLQTKADDGKVHPYETMSGMADEEYVPKFTKDNHLYAIEVAYRRNGKVVNVEVNFNNGVDNGNPEETDYFVYFEFNIKSYNN